MTKADGEVLLTRPDLQSLVTLPAVRDRNHEHRAKTNHSGSAERVERNRLISKEAVETSPETFSTTSFLVTFITRHVTRIKPKFATKKGVYHTDVFQYAHAPVSEV